MDWKLGNLTQGIVSAVIPTSRVKFAPRPLYGRLMNCSGVDSITIFAILPATGVRSMLGGDMVEEARFSDPAEHVPSYQYRGQHVLGRGPFISGQCFTCPNVNSVTVETLF